MPRAAQLPALMLLLAACAPARHEASEDAGLPPQPTLSAPPPEGASPPPSSPPPEARFADPPPSDATDDAPTTAAEPPDVPLPAAEARRLTLRRLEDDRHLPLHKSTITDHFGGKLPSPLEAQIVALPGARRAFLLYGPPAVRNPLVLVLDDKGALAWSKERPLAGVRPGVVEMALTAGPKGGLALIWYDPPTRLMAERRWGALGDVVADFTLLEVEACDAISALYIPGRGWVAVASQLGSARAQMLEERGKLGWGAGGVDLPWASQSAVPASIAADGDDSVMIFQVGYPAGGPAKTAPDHVLAARYDGRGTAVWARAIDLGASPRPARIAASRVESGVVRVTLPPGSSPAAVELTSTGAVRRNARVR